jgi:outer membrane lipoprotein-sorting protein
MKKLVFVLIGLVFGIVINAQSLNEIVMNYSAAMKIDRLASITSIKITSKMSLIGMGLEMPMVTFSKNPDKVKSITSINGQDIVSVFDGEKGYSINPLSGSTNPVELTGDQLKQAQDNNAFQNDVLNYFKNGELSFVGEENVNGKPTFILQAKLKNTPNFRFIDKGSYLKGTPIFLFIDKESYLLIKTSTIIHKKGGPIKMNYDSYMTDFVDIDGVVMPKKTTIIAGGTATGVILIDKIEVNVPMDDSIFKMK